MGAKQSGTQTSTQKVSSGPWDVQAPYLADVFSEAKNNYGTAKGNTYYGGESVAPFNAAQNTALNTTIGIGQGTDPGVAAASRNNVDTLNGRYLDPASNPWLKDTFNAAADPVAAQYQTATAPGTAGNYATAGRYGSGSYNNAMKQNQLGLGRSLDNLATSIYGGNYQNERANQMQAAGQAGGINLAQYINPDAALRAGNQQQAQTQATDTSNMAAYNYNRDQPTNALAQYRGLVDGNYGQNGTSTNSQPIYTNPLSTGLGVLGTGASIASKFMPSDQRLKTDIRLIGRTFDGQNIYAYRFLDSPVTEIGLLAQEVAQTRPDAVMAHESGYLMVDYAKALEAA